MQLERKSYKIEFLSELLPHAFMIRFVHDDSLHGKIRGVEYLDRADDGVVLTSWPYKNPDFLEDIVDHLAAEYALLIFREIREGYRSPRQVRGENVDKSHRAGNP